MQKWAARLLAATTMLALAGCPGNNGGTDAGTGDSGTGDSGPRDSGPVDARPPMDAPMDLDAWMMDVDAGDSGDIESGHTFLFTLDDDWVIDANFEGNDARWINHSCDPNCEVYLEEDEGGDPARDRLVICAMRAIRAGEKLTYDYGIVTREPITDEERALWACRCGAPNCKGLMLEYVPGPKAGGGP